MSWSEHGRPGKQILAATIVAGFLATMLGGCTIAPVYGTAPSGRSIAPELAAISIEMPSGRAEQSVRNHLLFAFTGGGAALPARYKLRLTVALTENLVGVTRLSVAPSYSLDVAVSYELTEISSNTILTRGVARGVASYDRSNQGFANERARIDAEDRGAASAADEIRLRIAAALAQAQQAQAR